MFSGLLLVAPAVPSEAALTKCPPLQEGTTCGHYHYHVLVWHIRDRTFQEVVDRRRFVSLQTCEKARMEAAKENQTLAEFMKTSVESSFQADQFRECHCDRTTDKGSPAYLDPVARTAQSRLRHDAAWATRERLLGSDAPRSNEFLRMLVQETRVDRFLRKPFPSRMPQAATPPASAALIETRIGGNSATPPIAANLSFIEIPVPAGTVSTPLATLSSGRGAREAETHPFFAYELARTDAILTASEKISEATLQSDVRQEVARRRRVLEKLRIIANACPEDGETSRALRAAADETARITIVRSLFGDVVARSWAPSDARGAAGTAAIPTEGKAAVVFDASADVAARRETLYATLGEDRQLSDAETQSFVNVVEELIGK